MQYIQLQGQIASTLDTPINGAYNLFVDTSDNLLKLKDENGNLIGGGGSSIMEITHSELFGLWDGGTLTPGQYYVITDYQTFYDQPNWTANGTAITTGNYKSGSIEPLVVLATSNDTFSPYAYSTEWQKDTIKYDISFTQTEVTNNPAKGRIYERIDEVGNRTDYDWRNVVFKRYYGFRCDSIFSGKLSVLAPEGSGTGSVTGIDTNFNNDFSVGDVLGVYNPNNSNSQIGGFDFYEIVNVSGSFYMNITGSYYNTISDTYYSRGNSYSGISPFQTNTVSIYKDEWEYSTFHVEGTPEGNGWYNNYLGDNHNWDTFLLSNNVFRSGDYRDNYFGSNVVGNTFDDDNYGNHCGRNFQYNSLTDDFDNNKIGDDFQYNFIDSDFQENIIGNDFAYNMLGDDDGTDFNNNIINGYSFSNNWTPGYDAFIENIINDGFNQNIIWNRFSNNLVTGGDISGNLFDGDTEYNQFKASFSNNKIYNNFQNNVINTFYTNTILNQFNRNQINGDAYDNVFSGSFYDNTIGNSFYQNTFQGVSAFNQIGTDFHNNTVGDSFGVGYGNPRANKIGNNVYNNEIGEYFYSNTISDNFYNNTIGHYFQQNTVLADNVNNEDFTLYYGNIVTIGNPSPNIGGSDGTYNGVASTTNGHGVGATFNVVVSSGVAGASIADPGKLYDVGNTLTITGSLIGGGSDLVLTVDTVTSTPVVYTLTDSTIVRNQNEQLRLTYFATSGYANVGIIESFD